MACFRWRTEEERIAREALPQIDDGSRVWWRRLRRRRCRIRRGGGRGFGIAVRLRGGRRWCLAKRLGVSPGGLEVLATDVSARRLGQMEARLKRFGYAGGIKMEVADAAKLPRGAGEFDLVLCDVPCSGTGTLARNPEIRGRLKVEEFARQAERQRRDPGGGSMRRVRVGGRLVYSTCSLEPEENEDVVGAVVSDGWRRGFAGAGVGGDASRNDAFGRAENAEAGCGSCAMGFMLVVLERL